MRVDKALSFSPEIGTRSRAAFLIENDHVRINGKPAKSSASIKAGDVITVDIPPAQPSEISKFDFPLDVLFEDKDILVINKVAGMVIHPSAGHESDTLVNALLAHTPDLSMKFGEERPGIVHRLDKETSGILVVAKNDFAHENLMLQFKERSTHRIYQAVCINGPRTSEGNIKSFLARHPTDRKRYASVLGDDKKALTNKDFPPPIGKWASTHFKVLKRKGGLSFIELKLETGRTHQIRVHLSEANSPIVGDSLYGADKKIKQIESRHIQDDVKTLSRFLLHACELGFSHPKTGERMFFKKDWPQEDRLLIEKWGLI